MPVWLRDADLLLQEHSWESGKQALPEAGVALLKETAFAWKSGKRLRVRETRMEANGHVYVHGTLDEARHHVLTANHPSPLSARRPPEPFIGCRHFSQVNALLERLRPGTPPIDW